jgi:hypothetical protein
MGAQFDSDVVIAFAAVLADEDDDYRYARRSDFRTPGAFSPDPAAVLIAGAA